MTAEARPSVLLLGATGFIGSRLLRALRHAGFSVSCGVRAGVSIVGCRAVEVDYASDHSAEIWRPRVAGMDAVINAVGILRPTRTLSFEAAHVAAPAALFEACAAAKVSKVIQISALGADHEASSRYHLSKRRGDEQLARHTFPWVIVQPSLVFGEGGASAALFTRLAVLPLLPLPGDGLQRVQPIHVDDLCAAIVRLLETDQHDGRRIAAVGARAVTLREFLGVLRRALGLGDARFIPVPMAIMRLAAAAGDRLPGMLLDTETLDMLIRGNVASPADITAVLGRTPRPVEGFIAPDTARAMATEARLGWLLPLMRLAIAAVWIATAIVSFGVYPVEDSYALLARVGLTGASATVALYGAALMDLVLGIGIFALRDRTLLWRAQIVLIAGYSLIIAWYLPEQWLHPYGPMLKNIPMLAAILMLHELERPPGVRR